MPVSLVSLVVYLQLSTICHQIRPVARTSSVTDFDSLCQYVETRDQLYDLGTVHQQSSPRMIKAASHCSKHSLIYRHSLLLTQLGRAKSITASISSRGMSADPRAEALIDNENRRKRVDQAL